MAGGELGEWGRIGGLGAWGEAIEVEYIGGVAAEKEEELAIEELRRGV